MWFWIQGVSRPLVESETEERIVSTPLEAAFHHGDPGDAVRHGDLASSSVRIDISFPRGREAEQDEADISSQNGSVRLSEAGGSGSEPESSDGSDVQRRKEGRKGLKREGAGRTREPPLQELLSQIESDTDAPTYCVRAGEGHGRKDSKEAVRPNIPKMATYFCG